MTTTLEILEAQNAVAPFSVELALVADALDALAAYEVAATSCASAMSAAGGMSDAVAAATSSADVVAEAGRVIVRSSSDGQLVHQLLDAVITACEQSEAHCAAHAHHHDHCRLHVAAAGEAIATSKALRAAVH